MVLVGHIHSQVDVETDFGAVALILLVDKILASIHNFSIFPVSRDLERCLTASV